MDNNRFRNTLEQSPRFKQRAITSLIGWPLFIYLSFTDVLTDFQINNRYSTEEALKEALMKEIYVLILYALFLYIVIPVVDYGIRNAYKQLEYNKSNSKIRKEDIEREAVHNENNSKDNFFDSLSKDMETMTDLQIENHPLIGKIYNLTSTVYSVSARSGSTSIRLQTNTVKTKYYYSISMFFKFLDVTPNSDTFQYLMGLKKGDKVAVKGKITGISKGSISVEVIETK